MSLVNTMKSLDEETRFAYLQAMGIDCWELKSDPQSNLKPDSPATIEKKSEILTDENFVQKVLKQGSQAKEIPEQAKVTLEKVEVDFESDNPAIKNAVIEKESTQVVENNQAKINQTSNITEKNNTNSSAFLKLVVWGNQNLKQENAKTLLIICRHQIDQPANSFATPTAPSQFMLDYINALQSFIDGKFLGINIRLAHLSEAGLGKEAVPMNNVLQNIQPDAALLLGDETVTHLFGSQVSIASLRGQLVDLEPSYKAFVSYHPFSLIENPSLKSLALDDLINLADYLSTLE